MTHEHLEDFDKPWCKAILDSPEYELLEHGEISRMYPPSKQNGTTTNAFWAETLASQTTIRACLSFYRAATSETFLLLSIGRGTDGHSGLLHGGMIATVLDELLGLSCDNVSAKSLMTVKMEVRYKKAISTPCLILGRGKITNTEGRKIWATGFLEDGEGTIFSESDALFLEVKSKL